MSKQEKMRNKDTLAQAYAAELGRNLRAARKDQHLTQDTLAYMIGTERPRISDIERGLVDARLSDIADLARVLDLDPGKLLDTSRFKLADYPAARDGHMRL